MTATVDADSLLATLRGRGADHTATEIAQQPGLWRELAAALPAWRSAHPALTELLARSDVRIVLTGAGTSAYAGEVVAPVLRQRRHARVDAVSTTSLVADPRAVFAEDVPTLLVSFARSGDSPESVAATTLADELLTEVHHLVLTCNPDGRLARDHADRPRSAVLLMPRGANDRGFAMTSSFTCMTLAARLVLGATDDDAAAELTERVATSVELSFGVRVEQTARLARAGHGRIVYLGSGPFEGLARESALKVMELTAGRAVALGESAMGFRHGPKAFLDVDTLALVYVSNDPYTRLYDLDIVAELRRTLPAGQVVTVGADGDADTGRVGNGDGDTHHVDAGYGAGIDDPAATDWDLPGLDSVVTASADCADRDRLDDSLRAVAAVVGAQLLALQTSLGLGLRSDNPFPSGEVNRVVQGVTVHALPAGATSARS